MDEDKKELKKCKTLIPKKSPAALNSSFLDIPKHLEGSLYGVYNDYNISYLLI